MSGSRCIVMHHHFSLAVWVIAALAVLSSEGSYFEDVVSKPEEFGYSPENGPHKWASQFNSCGGRLQSPINIDYYDVINDTDLPPLTWRGFWKPHTNYQIKNTYHSVEVTCPVSKDRPTLRGGPLSSDYVLSQIHFHWGTKRGSEHAVNDRYYGMEVHLVHYKTVYGTIEAASRKKDGLAVVALFLKVVPHYDVADMTPLVSALREVQKGGSNSTLPEHAMSWLRKYVDIEQYFTYEGSLTTPPCTENVTWIIIKRPGNIGEKQVREFRKLQGHEGRIVENRRPVQEVNGRTIVYQSQSEYDDYSTEDNIYFPF